MEATPLPPLMRECVSETVRTEEERWGREHAGDVWRQRRHSPIRTPRQSVGLFRNSKGSFATFAWLFWLAYPRSGRCPSQRPCSTCTPPAQNTHAHTRHQMATICQLQPCTIQAMRVQANARASTLVKTLGSPKGTTTLCSLESTKTLALRPAPPPLSFFLSISLSPSPPPLRRSETVEALDSLKSTVLIIAPADDVHLALQHVSCTEGGRGNRSEGRRREGRRASERERERKSE